MPGLDNRKYSQARVGPFEVLQKVGGHIRGAAEVCLHSGEIRVVRSGCNLVLVLSCWKSLLLREARFFPLALRRACDR